MAIREEKPIPTWMQIAGFCIGTISLLFIMFIIVLYIFKTGIYLPKLFFASFLAFSLSMSFSFIGGTAIASGSIPFIKKSPKNAMKFGVTGGIAVFIIIFILAMVIPKGPVIPDRKQVDPKDVKLSEYATRIENLQAQFVNIPNNPDSIEFILKQGLSYILGLKNFYRQNENKITIIQDIISLKYLTLGCVLFSHTEYLALKKNYVKNNEERIFIDAIEAYNFSNNGLLKLKNIEKILRNQNNRDYEKLLKIQDWLLRNDFEMFFIIYKLLSLELILLFIDQPNEINNIDHEFHSNNLDNLINEFNKYLEIIKRSKKSMYDDIIDENIIITLCDLYNNRIGGNICEL